MLVLSVAALLLVGVHSQEAAVDSACWPGATNATSNDDCYKSMSLSVVSDTGISGTMADLDPACSWLAATNPFVGFILSGTTAEFISPKWNGTMVRSNDTVTVVIPGSDSVVYEYNAPVPPECPEPSPSPSPSPSASPSPSPSPSPSTSPSPSPQPADACWVGTANATSSDDCYQAISFAVVSGTAVSGEMSGLNPACTWVAPTNPFIATITSSDAVEFISVQWNGTMVRSNDTVTVVILGSESVEYEYNAPVPDECPEPSASPTPSPSPPPVDATCWPGTANATTSACYMTVVTKVLNATSISGLMTDLDPACTWLPASNKFEATLRSGSIADFTSPEWAGTLERSNDTLSIVIDGEDTEVYSYVQPAPPACP